MVDTLKICKVRSVKTPIRGTSVAAGIDFFVPIDIDEKTMSEKCALTGCTPKIRYADNKMTEIVLKPGQSVMIPSGIKMKIPNGFALAFMNKSGVGAKKQLTRLAELVDQDYEGEVHINVVNCGDRVQTIAAGDKIIQGVLIPMNYAAIEEINTVEELYADSESARGEGGFGSTGTK